MKILLVMIFLSVPLLAQDYAKEYEKWREKERATRVQKERDEAESRGVEISDDCTVITYRGLTRLAAKGTTGELGTNEEPARNRIIYYAPFDDCVIVVMPLHFPYTEGRFTESSSAWFPDWDVYRIKKEHPTFNFLKLTRKQ